MTGRLQTMTNDWSIVTLDGSGGGNGTPQAAPGSIHINDGYIRSVGLWISQISAIAQNAQSTANAALSKPAVIPTCDGYPLAWVIRHPFNGDHYPNQICTAAGWIFVGDAIR